MRFLAFAVLALALGCLPAAQAEQTIPFTTIASGTQSGIRTMMEVVIRTPIEWNVLWRKHATGPRYTSTVPRVDFSREMVIAVFAGEAPSRTVVSIVRVVRRADRLEAYVRVADLHPGPAFVEQSTATPFHIVRLPRSALVLVFLPAKTSDVYRSDR